MKYTREEDDGGEKVAASFGECVFHRLALFCFVIARSEATKQSSLFLPLLDCFAPLAMTELKYFQDVARAGGESSIFCPPYDGYICVK